jgi:hypothetical protein
MLVLPDVVAKNLSPACESGFFHGLVRFRLFLHVSECGHLSLGEQSVGKSFALNHLLDTSFAGLGRDLTLNEPQ